MPSCPSCGFLYNVKRGSCLQCGRDLTQPPTEEEERQRSEAEAERGRQRPPTRSGCFGSCLAMVVSVAGILLLVPAAFATLFGLGMMGTDADYPPFTFDAGLQMFVMGIVGVAAAVGLLAIGVRVWRSSE